MNLFVYVASIHVDNIAQKVTRKKVDNREVIQKVADP